MREPSREETSRSKNIFLREPSREELVFARNVPEPLVIKVSFYLLKSGGDKIVTESTGIAWCNTVSVIFSFEIRRRLLRIYMNARMKDREKRRMFEFMPD